MIKYIKFAICIIMVFSLLMTGVLVSGNSVVANEESKEEVREKELKENIKDGVRGRGIDEEPEERKERIKQERIKVAVLNVSEFTDEISNKNIRKILNTHGIKAETITSKQITRGRLSEYDVLIVSGSGMGTEISQHLGENGVTAIKRFVENGGGFIGISAGAHLALSDLRIVDAQAVGIEYGDRGIGDIQIRLHASLSVPPLHPILKGYHGTITAYYTNGPVIRRTQVPDVPDYNELGVFVSDVRQNENVPRGIMPGSSAITASEFGNGRAVLFSFRPELTAGLERMLVQGVLWSAEVDIDKFNFNLPRLRTDRDLDVNGIWLWATTVRDLGPRGAEIVTEQLKRYGFTDIFLLVKGIAGTAAFDSDIALRRVDPNRDILEEIIVEARKRGLRVHAWFVIFSDRSWARAHPEDRCVHIRTGPCVDRSPAADPGPPGRRISLLSTAYRQYIGGLVREVLENYDVEGIHLDYVRTATASWGWDDRYIARATELGVNLDRVRHLMWKTFDPLNPDRDGRSIFEAYDRGDKDVVGWVNVRREAATTFAKEIRDIVENYESSSGREIVFSSALEPQGAYRSNFLVAQGESVTFSAIHYGQVYEDLVPIYELVVPMLYHREFGRSPQWVAALYENTVNIFGRNRVIAGLQAYAPVISEDLSDAIDFARQSNADKLAFFRYGTFGFSRIDLEEIDSSKNKMTVTMTSPFFAGITKVEISVAEGFTLKNVTGNVDGAVVTLSDDKRMITIKGTPKGTPVISQNQSIQISATVEEVYKMRGFEKGFEPAQVRFYDTFRGAYRELRVYTHIVEQED